MEPRRSGLYLASALLWKTKLLSLRAEAIGRQEACGHGLVQSPGAFALQAEGRKKIAREIGMEDNGRAILICDTLRIRHVPNDRRGILEIYVEGAELIDQKL